MMYTQEKRNDKTFLLRILLISILTIMWCGLVLGQEKYVVTATKLNVRKLPSAESTILGSLSKDDIVNVRSLKKSWAEIDFKENIGYVSLKYIQPVQKGGPTVTKPKPEPEPKPKPKPKPVSNNEEQNNTLQFRLTSSLSLGLSNFYSFKAYSHPRFGYGLDAGIQVSGGFIPDNMFAEMTVGFMMLGNSKYSFPSVVVNILPIGYRSESFTLGNLHNAKYYGVGGFSFQFGGGGIRFTQNSVYHAYTSKPTLNLYLKGGLELTNNIAVGIIYMHGLTNVCKDLTIGIKHSAFQVYGSFLFNNWKKK